MTTVIEMTCLNNAIFRFNALLDRKPHQWTFFGNSVILNRCTKTICNFHHPMAGRPSIPSSFISKDIMTSGNHHSSWSRLSCWILGECINELLPFLDENQRPSKTRAGRNGTRYNEGFLFLLPSFQVWGLWSESMETELSRHQSG